MDLKFFKGLVLSIALTGLSACSQQQTSQTVSGFAGDASIVNGRAVTAGELYAKHTVAVGSTDKVWCTGVIIGAHHVLTAGHCAEVLGGGNVWFGLAAIPATTPALKIKTVTLHPNYCDHCLETLQLIDNGNDLAIVEFEGTLPEGFEPVELASKAQLAIGTNVHLAGYGMNERYDYEDILKVTEAPVDLVGNFEIRTNEVKSGSCSGDSGGPAYILDNGKLLLAGITSRGDQYCRHLGIYTVPTSHQNWIDQAMNPSPVIPPAEVSPEGKVETAGPVLELPVEQVGTVIHL